MSELKLFYKNKLAECELNIRKYTSMLRTLSLLRTGIFVLYILLLIIVYRFGFYYIFSVSFVLVPSFLGLLVFYERKKNKLLYYNTLHEILKNEVSGFEGDYSKFESGINFISHKHRYSYDLDIFGEKSIFQLINRTCTTFGRNHLADCMQNPLLDSSQIIDRQNAVKELSSEIDFRLNFRTIGKLTSESLTEKDIDLLTTKNSNFGAKFFYKTISIALPLVTIIAFILNGFSIISYHIPVIFYLIQLALIGINLKKFNVIHSAISRKVKLLESAEKLFLQIEGAQFKSSYLNSIQSVLKKNNAGLQIKKLKQITQAFDYRLNMFFSMIGQGFLLWDLQCALKFEIWQNNNKHYISDWFGALGKIDMLMSFANFSFNNPAYTFPIIHDDKFYLETLELGHPLINNEKRVCNDFFIGNDSGFRIITGANMAGKSTFLRTVGVNLILAMCGSPVCARYFKFSPIALYTSIRTSDSLQENESYFYAELKRLKNIIDKLQQNEKLFVILDEILRGTNSKDKHAGSEALLKQLIRLNAVGIIATHDILLGELEKKFPENIKNFCFEVEIDNDNLAFDYKLKQGISKNLNASILMKKMGITF